jgi:hypothetical protein
VSTVFLENKERNKGVKGGSWQARRAFQQERDGMVIGLVDHYEVMTRELLCALLDWQRTLPNLKMAEKLLRRLGSQGHFHQIAQDGITYAVTLSISLRKKGERKQLAHRYMGARRASTLDRAIACDDKRTGRMLWAQGGRIVPDEFYRMGTHGLFFEDNVGRDHFANIPAKAALYDRDRDYLQQLYGIDSFHVVWNSKLASRVAKIVEALQGISQGDMFLVCHEEAFSPFDPLSILQPIFHSPHDHRMHRLLEDVYA